MFRRLINKINGRLKPSKKKEMAEKLKSKQYVCKKCFKSHYIAGAEFGEVLKCSTCGGKLREVL